MRVRLFHLRNSGYTVTEMVIVISLMGLFVSAVTATFAPVLETWALNAPRNEITDATEFALSRMSYEVTQLKDSSNVLIAQGGRLQFTDVSDNIIDYTLSGTNLMRNADILSRGVQRLSLTYYGMDGAVLPSPAVSPTETDIWRIQIEITGQRDGQSVSMTSQVRPRNLPRS